MDIVLLFNNAVPLSKSVAEYNNLVGSFGIEIKLRATTHLEIAMGILTKAVNSTTVPESLLRQAVTYFNHALGIETDERLAVAILGLALCYYHLNDLVNYQRALEKLVNLQVTNQVHARMAKRLLVGEHVAINFFMPLMVLFAIDAWLKRYEERKKKIEELKQSVRKYLNECRSTFK